MSIDKVKIKTIAVSRTDNIGDVILTLPVCGVLKQEFPNAKIIFIGKVYTDPIISCSDHVDGFINWDNLKELSLDDQANELRSFNIDLFIHVFPNRALAKAAKKAKIPYRLGTRNRFYHWGSCNVLSSLSRKKSLLHESQLNIKLLAPILSLSDYSLKEISDYLGFNQIPKVEGLEKYLAQDKKNIVLHPRSLGSAREWGLHNFAQLIELGIKENINFIITGTQKEKETFQKEILNRFQGKITDSTGQLSLDGLISLIAQSDGIIAASTGPLHIGAASGVHALGLYIMTKPMHPGRWKPIGLHAEYMVHDEEDESLESIEKIAPERVLERILSWT